MSHGGKECKEEIKGNAMGRCLQLAAMEDHISNKNVVMLQLILPKADKTNEQLT